jgi:predicted dehydrogenase
LALSPSAAGRQTLLVLDPGHFHAALTLRRSHVRLNDDVYVYADAGPDVEAFLELVESFNQRIQDPTYWRLHVYRGSDHLERLLSERRGEVVIVAGKNDRKLASIARLHEAGFSVLGDKPWLIEASQLERVETVAGSAPLAMDIMTERHEIANQVQRALMGRAEIFGALRDDSAHPAIAMKSTHHLYKTVNGRPLIRPPWYFDVAVQGEGIVDVTTHLVDLVQWLMGGEAFDYVRDVELTSARQWPTRVPLQVYEQITGMKSFEPQLSKCVADGALDYLCNAALSYRLRGMPVQIESIWALEIPPGGGDLHWCIARGEKADLIVDQSAATRFVPELFVHPAASSERYAIALGLAVAALQPKFPGLAMDPADAGAFHIRIPQTLRTTHEQHFAAVLDQFLGLAAGGDAPPNLIPDLICKYTLLARAAELSHRPA